MTDDDKKNLKALLGCTWIIAELLISTGVGGFFGWPMGMTIFGIAMLMHAAYAHRRMKREGTL